jgi:hypothetical protein
LIFAAACFELRREPNRQKPGLGIASVVRWDVTGKIHVIGKAYFERQAAILFWFAKTTKDPKISAALMEKAADLKLRMDDPSASSDLTPLALDIEPPSAT